MNIFQKILSFFPTPVQETVEKVKKTALRWRITRQYLWKVKVEVDRFSAALDAARNPLNYDRRELLALYREVDMDDQVATQTRIACVKARRAPFEVLQNGKAVETLKDMFQRPWFLDFLEVAIRTEFYGHSLIEFDASRGEDGQFHNISVIARDHVRPEYGDVRLQLGDSTGVPYRTDDFPYLFELGRPDDLGLYHIVMLPFIRKRYADTDWSLYSERYGAPFLTIKTASRDKKELDAKEMMASKFASNGYAILDDQDEINLLTTSNVGQAYLTFLARMEKSDEQIAKIINGQTSTSDQKAFVGSAEVHERLLDDFTLDRLTSLQYLINQRLLPFLVGHGYVALRGARFEFLELRKKEKEDGVTPTPKPDKSPRLNAIAQHYLRYIAPDEEQCCA